MMVSRPTRPTCSRASAVPRAGSFRLRALEEYDLVFNTARIGGV
jgi:hypothetical protein